MRETKLLAGLESIKYLLNKQKLIDGLMISAKI